MTELSLSDMLGQISIALDAVEQDLLGATPYHSKRVAVLSLEIGRALGYDRACLFSLAGCALLHDNALTEYILSEQPSIRQGANLQSHCIIGQVNCSCIPFPNKIDGFIQYHHEAADGSGVFGLRETEFPQEAGIIALADQVDVHFALQRLSASRLDEVRRYIESKAGTKFSDALAQAALSVLDASFLESVRDACIYETLLRQIPPLSCTLTNAQMISLSGIIAKIIDYKSKFTRMHTSQIANKAWYMTGVYGYDTTLRARVYQAATLHDIGKLFVPTATLEKPGRLTDEEFRTIQSHVRYTWELLHPIRGLGEIVDWASNHHEKLDGSGYPFGKRAHALDFISRLMTCLDIYQAVSEPRPYHAGRSHGETMRILYDMARRGQIDPDICIDLDREMAVLPNGFAPPPQESGILL